MNRTLGIILIGLGVVGLAWGGFSYTTRKNVVDIDPFKVTANETHRLPVPPIAGALALVGGIALIVAGKKA